MRPLQLDLVAFRSYDRASVDWRPHDLVVIAGDTGAGKTSLLDAISFALFGRTPESARPGELLTLGHTHGEVRLTFALDGRVWRVTRRFGRDAPDPAMLLELLDRDGGDAVETHGDRVDERVRRLVGMSFEAFTSAVLLAQGRFAQFLSVPPGDRDRILRELFSVAPMGGVRAAAKERQTELTGRAEGLLRAVDTLPAHGAAVRTGAARAARAAAVRLAGVRALEPLAVGLGNAHERARRDAQRVTDLEAAVAVLPDEAALSALSARIAAAQDAVAAAERAVLSARADRTAAEAAVGMLALRHGAGAAELGALGEVARAAGDVRARRPERAAQLAEGERLAEELAVSQQRLTEEGRAAAGERDAAVRARDALIARADGAERALALQHALTDAGAARDAAARAHDVAVAARDAAQQAHDHEVRLDLAAAVRGGLAPGDPCPVCGGAVGNHRPTAAGDITALRLNMESAQGAERAASTERTRAALTVEGLERDLASLTPDPDPPDAAALQRAHADVAALEDRLDRLRQRHQEQHAQAARHAAALAQLRERDAEDGHTLERAAARLGAWAAHPDPVAALEAAVHELRDAEEAQARAGRALSGADAAAAQAGAALHDLAGRELAVVRDALTRLITLAGLSIPPPAPDATALLAGCARAREGAGELLVAARQAASASADAARVAAHRFARVATGTGVDDATQVPAASGAAHRAREQARVHLAGLDGAAVRAAALRAEARDAEAQAGVYATVVRDLQVNNFPRFLLARFRERLAAGASMRLQDLTGGAFRFTGREPDPLAVVDLRRGERQRSAATLSGGERFMASLALALGLSDIAAESGGRLDCLFLDEGFSTLDAESLEQALAGVERLTGDGRLVAVITHLPGVADRLGSTIRVAKNAEGVSSVVAPG